MGSASAADITLSWTNATRNVPVPPDTEGTLIPTDTTHPDSLASTTIYWGACLAGDIPAKAEGLELTVDTTVPGQAESAQVIITTPGRWCFVGVHKNLGGVSSADSNPTFRYVANIPSPPDNLTVQNIIVYYVIQRNNRFTLLPVGTIALDTACISTEYVNGYHAVDRDLVEWSGSTQPLVVVAQCG